MIHKCYSNVTQNVIHKRHSKSDPRTSLKNWPTTVIQKLTRNCYSKVDPQTLLKNWPTTVTQKFSHKRYSKLTNIGYSKIDSQTLLKKWPTNVFQKKCKTITCSWVFSSKVSYSQKQFINDYCRYEKFKFSHCQWT